MFKYCNFGSKFWLNAKPRTTEMKGVLTWNENLKTTAFGLWCKVLGIYFKTDLFLPCTGGRHFSLDAGWEKEQRRGLSPQSPPEEESSTVSALFPLLATKIKLEPRLQSSTSQGTCGGAGGPTPVEPFLQDLRTLGNTACLSVALTKISSASRQNSNGEQTQGSPLGNPVFF